MLQKYTFFSTMQYKVLFLIIFFWHMRRSMERLYWVIGMGSDDMSN